MPLNYNTIIGALNGLFGKNNDIYDKINDLYDKTNDLYTMSTNIYNRQHRIHEALENHKLFGFSFRRSISGSGSLDYALKTAPSSTCRFLALPPIITTDVELFYNVYINSTITDYGTDVKSSVVDINRVNPVSTCMAEWWQDITVSDYGLNVLPDYVPASRFSGGHLPEGLHWIMSGDSYAVLNFENQGVTAGTVRFATYFIELDPEE